jgi:uncharacterized protein (DUF885 family)
MRTDRQLFFDSADAVLVAYRAMSERVDPTLPTLFHTVPRMRYAVRAMTPSEAASSTAANYQVGSLKLGTSGYFTINALGYASEAKWRVETLFLARSGARSSHADRARRGDRGVPSVALAGELQYRLRRRVGAVCGVARVRPRVLQASATAIRQSAGAALPRGASSRRHRHHAFQWPRDKAIAYMEEEGGVDREFAVSEVDRYFSNPDAGARLSARYHKMRELRTKAETRSAAASIRRTSTPSSIDNGSMPLVVLEQLVDDWIARGGGANTP